MQAMRRMQFCDFEMMADQIALSNGIPSAFPCELDMMPHRLIRLQRHYPLPKSKHDLQVLKLRSGVPSVLVEGHASP